MAKGDDKNPTSDIPHERKEPRPDFSVPPPPTKLPKELQDKLNDEDGESLWITLYEGEAPESTNSSIRYAAYASRIRTILLSAHRYVAYTSDIGESFRPIAHPYLIKSAYAVSWAYLAGDVAHEGYKAYLRNQRTLLTHDKPLVPGSEGDSASAAPEKQSLAAVAAAVAQKSSSAAPAPANGTDGPAPHATASTTLAVSAAAVKDLVRPTHVAAIDDYRAVMAQRAVFQSVASMGLPAFTIHSIVKYAGRALKDAKNKSIRTYGPIGLGLAAVPFLPFVFDKPVEHAVEWTFHKGFELVGGPEAVHGVAAQRAQRAQEKKEL